MDREELEEALAGESERVEWKQSVRPDEMLRAVCALANDLGNSRRPGFLVIGRADNGQNVGISTDPKRQDEEQQKLVSRLTSSKLFPTPTFNVEVIEDGAAALLITRVDPYPVPPVVTVDGAAWVRKGTVTELARESDLTRLRERRPEKALSFDSRILPGAALSDLALAELTRMYEAARGGDADSESFPDLSHWLAARDLGRVSDGTFRPNSAALLLFGLSPQSLVPAAVVEFVRYGGADFDSTVVTRRTASGTLPDQLEVLWAQLNANLADVPGSGDGIRTPYVPEYPLEALKELARNLVQHRLYEGTNAPGRIEWFENRIVFSNPGGPFGQASEGEFGVHSDYRNPTLTRWLLELGYVEKLGRGIQRARRLLEVNGNSPLIVETDGYTRLTVMRRP